MKKRTKIVATLGPACESVEKIGELIGAGVDVFRLNFSHGTHAYHTQMLLNIREAMKRSGSIVGVLQDISGPKIRIGELEENFNLNCGDILEFVREDIVGYKIKETHYRLSLNQKEIIDKLEMGQFIYLYDGILRARVVELGVDSVCAVLENDGILSSKKGINFPNTRINVEVLTPKDRADIEWGVQNGVDFIAISFVQNAQDMLNARALVERCGGEQMLIAKIEKFDAIENIDEILEASDGLMVARGDLGIEVPFYEVPNIQKMLIKKANYASKPVIVATQMLLSMIKKQRATRAEISDIANAVLDGADAVMLSEESAVGEYPVLAVSAMFETICESEKEYAYHRFYEQEQEDVTTAIDEAAVKLAKDLSVSGIFSLTNSGSAARKLAKYRPNKPIYAITHSDVVRHQLTLSWGISPFLNVVHTSIGQILKEIILKGLQMGVIDKNKLYIVTAGDPTWMSGSTTMIRLLRKEEIEFFKNL